MKSTINLENTKTKSEYPCLKIYADSDGCTIVLFTKDDTGVCVHSSLKQNVVGDYLVGSSVNSWAEYKFQPFNGTVTLSND